MDSTTPMINIHIALPVGEPVKNREMSDPSDFDALIPRISSSTPPARNASEVALFTVISSFHFSRLGYESSTFDPLESPTSLTAKGLRPVHVGHDLRATPFRQLAPAFYQALAVTFAADAEGHGRYEPEPCPGNPIPALFTHPIGSIEKLLKSVVDLHKFHRLKFPEARL
jgi:hypothetical protein